jgi:magnesium transporter
MSSTTTIGILINIVGSISINLGTNLLKYSHIRAQQKKALEDQQQQSGDGIRKKNSRDATGDSSAPIAVGKQASGAGTKMWYIGFIIFAIGNVGNFASFSLAPQSLLASLGSVQFLTNVAFSYFILGTKITFWVILGTSFILIGNTLVVVFSSKSNGTYTIAQLMNLYISPTYSTYLTVLALGTVGMYFLNKHCKNEQKRFVLLKFSLQNPLPIPALIIKLEAVSYALISGFIGTQSVILAKSSSELLRKSFQGESQFGNVFTYFILIFWIGTMVFWLKRMNKALQKFDGVFIIPFLQVIWIVLSIIGGGLYFQEFQTMTGGSIVCFVFGVLLILIGVFCLAPSSPKKKKQKPQKAKPISPVTLGSSTVDMNLEMDTQAAQILKKADSSGDNEDFIVQETNVDGSPSSRRRASQLINSIVVSTIYENISDDENSELQPIEEEERKISNDPENQIDAR